MKEFEVRKNRYFDEFKWLYCELYEGGEPAFHELISKVGQIFEARTETTRELDILAALDPDAYRRHDFDADAMTAAVYALTGDFGDRANFDRTAAELLKLANQGASCILLTGIDRLFVLPGSGVSDLRKTHNFLRMLRILIGIAAPSVLLMGDPMAEFGDRTAFFGSAEKPELHLMTDKRFMPTLWHTVATKDTRLLAHELRTGAALRTGTTVRSLSSAMPERWELDFDYLACLQMEQKAHLLFLDDYFTKRYPKAQIQSRILELFYALLFSQGGIIRSELSEEETDGIGTAEQLMTIRRSEAVFDSDADFWTPTTGNDAVLGIGRYKNGRKFYGLFNFSDTEQIFELRDPGRYRNLLKNTDVDVVNLIRLNAYGYAWLMA